MRKRRRRRKETYFKHNIIMASKQKKISTYQIWPNKLYNVRECQPKWFETPSKFNNIKSCTGDHQDNI